MHIFMLPPAGGNATVFSALAPLIAGKNKSIHVLQKGPSAATFSTLIDHHCRHLLSVDPTGPYTLVGHSLGCLFAFALASSLRLAGRHIRSLVLLDSVSLQTPPLTRLEDAMCLFARGQGRLSGPRAASLHTLLHTLPSDEHRWSVFLTECDYPPAEHQTVRELTLNLQSDIALAASASASVSDSAVSARVCEGTQVLGMWAEENDEFVSGMLCLREAVGAWQQVVGRQMLVHKVKGDHWSMLAHPHVEVLAQNLLKFIDVASESDV